jgi:DNA-binding transcriptional LysR family regulator
MVRDELSVMSAFLAVADERSFTKAAKRLGVSQSALSHAIRGLEEQLGVRLLARTTRSVAPTAAGEQLIAELRPALGGIRGALEKIAGSRGAPRGRLRLQVSPLALRMVVAPKLPQFARAYPDIVLDMSTDETRRDLVENGFDAGIQYGEFIQADMVAVRVSSDLRTVVAGSPAYLEQNGTPKVPHDLLDHRCINYRRGGGGEIYRWEFERGEKSVAVAVKGTVVTDDIELLVQAAIDGVGLAYLANTHAAPHLASGALVEVLEDWSPSYPGFFLYYPSRKQQPAALAALIDTLRVVS